MLKKKYQPVKNSKIDKLYFENMKLQKWGGVLPPVGIFFLKHAGELCIIAIIEEKELCKHTHPLI